MRSGSASDLESDKGQGSAQALAGEAAPTQLMAHVRAGALVGAVSMALVALVAPTVLYRRRAVANPSL